MNKTKNSGAWCRALVLASAVGFLLPLSAAPAGADTMRERQWYLKTMQAERMWRVSTGKGITVAVLDSGVRSSQPELEGRVHVGRSFASSSDTESGDSEHHGTAMATLIAGRAGSGQGVQGLAPDARILSVKLGDDTMDNSVLAKALRYAADSEAQIISMSLGMKRALLSEKQDREMQAAVAYAIKKGKLLIAGSGNGGDKGNAVEYPAAIPGVAAISAVDGKLTATKFSTHGPQVALGAPGEKMPIPCDRAGGYCESRGTSQATAIASASAALVWSLHPKWTGNQVLRVLLDTAGRPPRGKVPSEYVGYGLIRPRENVLENKGNPGPPDVNPLVEAAEKDGKSSAKGASPSAPVTHEPALATGKKSKSKDKDDNLPWFIGGAIALAVPGAVLVALMVRRGRRKAKAKQQRQQAAAAAGSYGGGPYGGTMPVEPPYPPQQPPTRSGS
ncbi:S8 family serine peptidase [Streptomyces huiliensis]|uniref:S8 family serine peptidase n=1 Tax=Streptomyces huiliensis TaxID=2876027 RepID=UPI001CBFF757|nr:S8 family serine peptidase [Streptomyces huiliensis]